MSKIFKKITMISVLGVAAIGNVHGMDFMPEMVKIAENAVESVREGVRKYPLAVAGVAVAGAAGVAYLYHHQGQLHERVNDLARDVKCEKELGRYRTRKIDRLTDAKARLAVSVEGLEKEVATLRAIPELSNMDRLVAEKTRLEEEKAKLQRKEKKLQRELERLKALPELNDMDSLVAENNEFAGEVEMLRAQNAGLIAENKRLGKRDGILKSGKKLEVTFAEGVGDEDE